MSLASATGGANPKRFDSLYSTIVDPNVPISEKLQLLNRFKGHVKKEFVDVQSTPSYFKALLYVYPHFQDSVEMITFSHSALCYLIKRVAYQSPNTIQNNKKLIYDLLSYFIDVLNRMEKMYPHLEKKTWFLSNKAIETMYLVVPLYVEDCVANLFTQLLKTSMPKLKFLLLIIDDLTGINLQGNSNGNSATFLKLFIPNFLTLLKDNSLDVTRYRNIVELIKDLLTKYVDADTLDHFTKQLKGDNIKALFDGTVGEQKQEGEVDAVSQQTAGRPQSQNIFDLDMELHLVLNEYKSPQVSSLNSTPNTQGKKPSTSMANLTFEITQLLVPFHSSKETEQNWRQRQANITTLREKISSNNNLILANAEAFVSALKDCNFIEKISKAVLSLRTSLSVNGCQLLKDLFQILGDHMTITLIDQCFLILKPLLSSTKKISSSMAFHCFVTLFVHINEFHNKLFQNAFMLINEKTVNPRNSSAIFLRIFILKFNGTKHIENNLLYIEEWLKKGLADAQTVVRESMRSTFWYFYKCYPQEGKSIINKLTTVQTRKSLESSIPVHLNIEYTKTNFGQMSSNNSRRSSLLGNHFQSNGPNATTGKNKRMFPSYAQPTQASQKINGQNLRSTSDNIGNTSNETNVLKKSKTNGGNAMSTRKVSAPPVIKQQSIWREDANNNQFDLTDELKSPTDNSLIKKYLHDEKNKDVFSDLQSHLSHIENLLQQDPTNTHDALKQLSTVFDSQTECRVNITALVPGIRKLMLKNPHQFAELAGAANFLRSIPLAYSIELSAILGLAPNIILSNFQGNNSTELTSTICDIFSSLTSINASQNDSLFYMKYRDTIFNFTMETLSGLLSGFNAFGFNLPIPEYENLLAKTFLIYGSEFNTKLYFDLLFDLYQYKKDSFEKMLMNLNLVSQRLKIYQEIHSRDPNFQLPNHSDTIKLDSDDGFEIKKSMEMTMVNPFNETRSLSNGSVVHNFDNVDINENTTEAKLSGMTRVISVYQDTGTNKEAVSPVKEESEEEEVKTTPPKIDLSGIFNKNKQIKQEGDGEVPGEEMDHTVKFSLAPPQVINDELAKENQGYVTETKKSPNVKSPNPTMPSILTESNQNSEPFIKKENEKMDIPHFTDCPPGVSRMLALIPYDSLSSYLHFSLLVGSLHHASMSPLEKINIQFSHLQKAIGRIRNGSFTPKHLTYLVEPFLSHTASSEQFVQWLEKGSGYTTLLEICLVLLKSTDETVQIPTNMISKTILLAQCLFYMRNELKTNDYASLHLLDQIWEQLCSITDKVANHDNEIHTLLVETRRLLANVGYFDLGAITKILGQLNFASSNLKDKFNKNESFATDPKSGARETFLLGAIVDILSMRESLVDSKNYLSQLSDIVQAMVYFVSAQSTEWRHESCKVLARVYKLSCMQSEIKSGDISTIFSPLDKQTYDLIRFMESRN